MQQQIKPWALGIGALVAGAALATAVMVARPGPEVASATNSSTSALAVPDRAPAPRVVSPPPQRVAEAPRPAPRVCNSCGVVESVQAVQVKGQPTGAGAVVGGVLGGVVGNQMGDGNGRKAMTVIGAIGGGVAGNEVEKRRRASTQYQVRVRMDDGSLRTVTMAEAPVGQGERVSVDGQSLRRL